MATHQSVAEASKASDAVVAGRVLDSGRAAKDHGLSKQSEVAGAPDPSIPVLVYTFQVEQVLGANQSVPGVIDVVIPSNAVDGVTKFVQGEQMVLFLLSFPQTGVDGIKHGWAPVSYDNSEFVVTGDKAQARNGQLKSLRVGEKPGVPGRLSASIAELTTVVRESGTAPRQQ